MDITEVRVKLVHDPTDKLLAYCTITLGDGFVIRDLKLIDGPKGPFVAMPSRKLTERCPRCGGKNHLRANYCNDCGHRLPAHRRREESGRVRLHADVAHPINARSRELLLPRRAGGISRRAGAVQATGLRAAPAGCRLR